MELLSDEGMALLPFSCRDFLHCKKLFIGGDEPTHQQVFEMRKMPIKLLRAGIDQCILSS